MTEDERPRTEFFGQRSFVLRRSFTMWLIIGLIVGVLIGLIFGVFIGFSLYKRAGTWD